jgi:hypothetical protein
VPYEIASEPFRVAPCRCLRPDALGVRRGRRGVSLTLRARYADVPDSFRLLPERLRGGHAIVHALRRGRRVKRIVLRFRAETTERRRTVKMENLDGRRLPVTIAERLEGGRLHGRWRTRRSKGVAWRLTRLVDRYGNTLQRPDGLP